jgi:hypothetical protein
MHVTLLVHHAGFQARFRAPQHSKLQVPLHALLTKSASALQPCAAASAHAVVQLSHGAAEMKQAVSHLLEGHLVCVHLSGPATKREVVPHASAPCVSGLAPGGVLLPGSFNPLHHGHTCALPGPSKARCPTKDAFVGTVAPQNTVASLDCLKTSCICQLTDLATPPGTLML